ncbi:hypothetical protein EMCRGX_G034820 [Ephydatia muelleri]
MHSLFLVFLMLLLTAVADTQLGGEVRNQNRRAVLATVQGVDVYVYYPMRNDPSKISALVVWDMPDGTVPITSFVIQVFNSQGVNIGSVATRSNVTFAALENRDEINRLTYILMINHTYTITVSTSPPQQLFAVGNFYDTSTIVNIHIQERSPVAVNTVGREVYWYSANNELLRGYFDSNSVQLWLTIGWEKEYILRPEQEDHFLYGECPSSIPKDWRIYAYWTTQDTGRTVLYQQDLRAISGTIPTRSLDQSITNIQLQAMTLDPTNGRLWVSDAATGNILSCNATAWNCSVEVNATVLMNNSNAGIPATSIALDENYVYWTSQYTPGIFYTNISGSSALQIHVLSYGNTSAIFSTSPGQQPLPAVICLSYDPATRPVPYQVSATNASILIGWNVLSLSAVCQRSVFSFPTLTYAVNVLQYMGRLSQYPSPGVITLGTTFTLDRNLSAFMPYNVQVAAYNRYTVSKASFMYNSTTGVVAIYGPLVDIMTSEGVPGSPTNVTACTTGTHSVLVSWMKPDSTLYMGSLQNIQFFVYVNDTLAVVTVNTSIELNSSKNITADTNYLIKILTFNGVFTSANPTSIMVTTWPLPPLPAVTNVLTLNNTILLSINVTLLPKHMPISKLYVQVEPNATVSNFTTTSDEQSLINTTIAPNGIIFEAYC